jgi:elongation factor P--(R)-beta-lysine ligase
MPNSLRNRLQRRALRIAEARNFFASRQICEVDCIALGTSACIDVNIDLFEVSSPIHGKRYLFSSPEYPMKRLLSEGSGDIFYLGHVWRQEDSGTRHSPEFLMAEWYRVGYSFEQMITETIDFVQLFTGNRATQRISYREAFIEHLCIDPFVCHTNDLREMCSEFEGYPIRTASKDELLNLLLSLKIEPHFPKNEITALYHYPASMAALARHVHKDNQMVAERFELYCEGLEIANGYCELTDASEQRCRFAQDNHERDLLGKPTYPIDERFLSCLTKGMPSCSGVAVGMDRLFMIEEKESNIHHVLPIGWGEA